MSERANRRLAGIVAADVAGFSRLVGADEEGTLAALRAHRRELVDPALARHGGRIANTAGDSLLLEFPSVVDALRCAIALQEGMAARNAGLPEERRILFRVGINLGDVVAEGDDLLGDGVNVAARLEGLAEPGGIVLSRAAHEQVLDRVEAAFDDLGEVEVKNIARPVRAFRLLNDGVATDRGASAKGSLIPPLPSGPRIVVLPFDNLSADPEQEFFVDGLTEDLTTRLSQLGYLFVIARNSAFKYKGQSPDVREVGRDFGVDYVVEGSIRRAGDQIRVNAQLLSASDGTHVWADTYDRRLSTSSIFEIQDELTIGIAEAVGGWGGAIAQSIHADTATRPPNEIRTFDAVLLAHQYLRTLHPTIHARARTALEDALSREPNYAVGWAALGYLYLFENEMGHNQRPDHLERAGNAVERAMELDPRLPAAVTTHARIAFNLRRKEDALQSLNNALELGPNQPNNLHRIADQLAHLGEWERAIAVWQRAKDFDPTPPPWTYFTPQTYFYQQGNYRKSYEQNLIMRQMIPNFHWVPGSEAMILSEMDRMDEAREALDRTLKLHPDFPRVARAELENWWWPQPEFIDRMMEALHKAGLRRTDATDG